MAKVEQMKDRGVRNQQLSTINQDAYPLGAPYPELLCDISFMLLYQSLAVKYPTASNSIPRATKSRYGLREPGLLMRFFVVQPDFCLVSVRLRVIASVAGKNYSRFFGLKSLSSFILQPESRIRRLICGTRRVLPEKNTPFAAI